MGGRLQQSSSGSRGPELRNPFLIWVGLGALGSFKLEHRAGARNVFLRAPQMRGFLEEEPPGPLDLAWGWSLPVGGGAGARARALTGAGL